MFENILGLTVVGGIIFGLMYYVGRGNQPGSIPQLDDFIGGLESIAVRPEVLKRIERSKLNAEKNKKAKEKEDPGQALEDMINEALRTSVNTDFNPKPPISLVEEALKNSLAYKVATGNIR